MKSRWKLLTAGITAVLACGAGVAMWSTHVAASDHNDPPGAGAGGVTDNPSADIDDLYVWHDTTAGTVTVVLTFSGPVAPTSTAGIYNRNNLFQIHINNGTGITATAYPDTTTINFRFAQDSTGAWGIQAENVPGATGDVMGAVETTITAGTGGNVKLFAGLRDDPFFFDHDGFVATLGPAHDGALHFMPTRDTFAGKNVTAIVLQMPLTALTTGATGPLSFWASSGVAP